MAHNAGLSRGSMRAYLLRRLLLLVPILLGVSTLVFLLIHLIPGDPVEAMLGEAALPADKEALRRELKLDLPLHRQYLLFLQGLLQGDLGRSLVTKEPVVEMVVRSLGPTVELALASLFVAVSFALALGIAAAVKRNRLVDRGCMAFALFGTSVPNFVLGPLLIILFSVQLGWLPVSGRKGPESYVLPALTLGMAMAGLLSRMTRSSLLEVLGKEYIAGARAKGLPEWQVILRHGLKNALLPIITVVGLQFGALLSVAIITETIFAWPGLGRLTIQAIHSRDYPLAQGCVLFISLGYALANLLADLLYAHADPRIRYR